MPLLPTASETRRASFSKTRRGEDPGHRNLAHLSAFDLGRTNTEETLAQTRLGTEQDHTHVVRHLLRRLDGNEARASRATTSAATREMSAGSNWVFGEASSTGQPLGGSNNAREQTTGLLQRGQSSARCQARGECREREHRHRWQAMSGWPSDPLRTLLALAMHGSRESPKS